MLYKIIAASALVAVASAAPPHPALSLQSPDPAGTRALCEACVAGEEVLVQALYEEETQMSFLAAAAVDTSMATSAHDSAVTTLAGLADGVAEAKAAVAAFVGEDEAALAGDAPTMIISNTDGLAAAAHAWQAAIEAHSAQQAETGEALNHKTAAETAELAAKESARTSNGAVTSARASADRACAAMRGAGYMAPVTSIDGTKDDIVDGAIEAPDVTSIKAPVPTPEPKPAAGAQARRLNAVAPKPEPAASSKHSAATVAAVEALYAKIKKERELAKTIGTIKAQAKAQKLN